MAGEKLLRTMRARRGLRGVMERRLAQFTQPGDQFIAQGLQFGKASPVVVVPGFAIQLRQFAAELMDPAVHFSHIPERLQMPEVFPSGAEVPAAEGATLLVENLCLLHW